jgi:RNA polymerase sigma factor (sigma-70 family)
MTPPPAEELLPRLFLGPALRAQPDRRLVRLVRDGYETAFDEIMRRYGGSLRRYAGALVGGRAEDVTQEAFSKALQALRRDDAEIELRPWLYRIVRNTALNDIRDRHPATLALADGIVGQGGVAEEVERREEIGDLIERLRALPEPQRTAIVMRELEGLGHDEIASALGISGGAARQTIHRARTALRDGLGMAIPLPLLRLLMEGAGGPTAEIAAGGAGAGVMLKAATATVLVAGTFGASVALHQDRQASRDSARQAETAQGRAPHEEGAARSAGAVTASAGHRGPSEGRGSGHRSGPDPSTGSDEGSGGSTNGGSRRGPAREGPNSGSGGGDRHPGSSPGAPGNQIRTPGENSGEGGSGGRSAETGDDNGGPEGNSGPGSVESGGGSGETGSGESGSGESLESNSGPGGGGDGGGGDSGSGSGESRDPSSGEGFSGQTQLRLQEER